MSEKTDNAKVQLRKIKVLLLVSSNKYFFMISERTTILLKNSFFKRSKIVLIP